MKKKDSTKIPATASMIPETEAVLKSNYSNKKADHTRKEVVNSIHELEAKNAKLEKQNAELKHALHIAVTESSLYDSSILSFFTLDREGFITDLTSAAAGMIGIERSSLNNSNFKQFIAPDSLSGFNYFLANIFESHSRQTCEVKLAGNADSFIYTHLIGIVSEDKQTCQVTAFDIRGQRQVEEEVKYINDLLSDALEMGNLSFWEMTLPLGEIKFNERQAIMLGYEPLHFMHFNDFTALVHPDDLESVTSTMRSHFEGEQSRFGSDYRIRNSEGEYRWFRDIGRVTQRDNNGQPSKVRGVVMDITDRKKVESAFKEREFFFNETQRVAVIGSYKTDFIKGCWESSEMLDQIFGIDKNYDRSIEGWLDIVHPDDRAAMDKYLKENVNAKREPFMKQYRILRKSDGEVRWVAGLGETAFDDQGNILSLTGTIQDITNRMQAEEALRLSEEKWKSIILTSPDGIAIATLDGTLLFGSDTLRKIYGYTATEEITGENIYEFIDESYHDKASALVDDILKGRHPEVSEFLLKRKDGTRFFMEINAEILRDNEGAPDRMFFILRDITERKRMQEVIEKRIVALTRPLVQDSPVLFDELFDLESIQAIQDAFAAATGVSSLIIFPDGKPITRPSRYTHFCSNIIRQTEKGCSNCLKSDILLGSPDKGGPVIMQCLSSGLYDAGASITVGGRHIASWLIGQVRDETQTEETMLEYAREIGADETEFLKAFREVPVMSLKQFEKVAQSLYLLAKQLSVSAYQNIQQARFISEHGLAEAKMKESEVQFRNIFDNAADAIFIADFDSRKIVDANQAASALMHMPLDKIIGLYQHQIHPPVNASNSTEIFDRHKMDIQNSISVHPVEGFVLRSDGSSVPVEIMSSLVNFKGKKCLMGTFRDISERKFMQETVFENEKRYRQLVESSPYGIAVYQEGQFVYVNPAAIKLLGARDMFDLLGLPVLAVIHPDFRVEIIKRMKLVIDGYAFPAMEESMIRLDGSQFDAEVVELSTTYNKKPAGQLLIRDITDSKLAKAEIYKLNEELEQRVIERTSQLEAANKELESFSYSVSHDLRTPLRALDGFANILLEDYSTVLDPEGKRLLGVIISNANKMGYLIDDLLAFSRLGRLEIESENINMYAMAKSAYEELASEADKEKIDFRLHFLPDACGDPAMMRQVWLNLIGNAIKYTSKKTNRIIEVMCETGGAENIYCISDNGAGFNMANSAKLFGVFQRLHTPKEFDGIGIGLAIVNRIVTRHKGRVWAEGEVGIGAKFYFTVGNIS